MTIRKSNLITPSANQTLAVQKQRAENFPQLPADLVANAYLLRTQLLNQLVDPRRNIDAECGYPASVTPQQYRGVFDRNGIGRRCVTVYPEETWAMDPEVYEDEDPTNDTEFEEVFKDLIQRRDLWHHLPRADMMSGIGHFGVLLLGLNDGKELHEPVRKGMGDLRLEQPIPPGVELLYLRHFDHSLARIIQTETDKRNPRYGQPTMYDLSFADYRNGEIQSGSIADFTSRNVHWTRVLHLADNRLSSEVFGVPRMQCVFNNLMDVVKMLGGSAEMFWKGGFPGFAFESTPNLNDLGSDVTMDEKGIRAAMDAYQNGLQRYFALLGVQVKSLAPQAVPPTGHLEEQYKAITIALGVPMRVFMGSEMGQLASGQDSMAWNKRLKRRQDKYVTPMIIRPFIDRLIWLGILPMPNGGDVPGRYFVDWPDLSSPTDMDRAQTAATRTSALATYVSGGIESLIPPKEYLTQFIGLSQEEATMMIEAAADHQEEMDAQQAQQQQEHADMVGATDMVPQSAQVGPIGYGPKPPPEPKGKTTQAKRVSGNRDNKIKTNSKRVQERWGDIKKRLSLNEWDAAKHPRAPKGSKQQHGGQFASKNAPAAPAADPLAQFIRKTKKRVNQPETDENLAAGVQLALDPTQQIDGDVIRHLGKELNRRDVWQVRAIGRRFKIPLGGRKHESINRIVNFVAKKRGLVAPPEGWVAFSRTVKHKKKDEHITTRLKNMNDAMRAQGAQSIRRSEFVKKKGGPFTPKPRVVGGEITQRLQRANVKRKAAGRRELSKRAFVDRLRNDVRVLGVEGQRTKESRRAFAKKHNLGPKAKTPRSPQPLRGDKIPVPDVADWKVGVKKELSQGTITNTKPLMGGINGSYVVTYDNGMKGVWKPESEGNPCRGYFDNLAIREAGASTLADALGWSDLVPPTIVRLHNGEPGSIQKFEDNAINSAREQDKPFDGRENAKRLAAFDYIIKNNDRHGGNFMVKQPDKDRLVAIDHGYSMPSKDRGGFRSHPYDHVSNDKIPSEYSALAAKVPSVVQALTEIGLDKKAIDGVVLRIETISKNADRGSKFYDLKGA